VLEFFQQRFLEKDLLPEYSNMLYTQIKDRYCALKTLNEQESQVKYKVKFFLIILKIYLENSFRLYFERFPIH
jgi:hypothetical protein